MAEKVLSRHKKCGGELVGLPLAFTIFDFLVHDEKH